MIDFLICVLSNSGGARDTWEGGQKEIKWDQCLILGQEKFSSANVPNPKTFCVILHDFFGYNLGFRNLRS